MSSNTNMDFLEIATDRTVVRRALRIALVVGSVLAMINQGDRVMTGQIDMGVLTKIILTYFVPYSVSTYSSYLAVRDNLQRTASQEDT